MITRRDFATAGAAAALIAGSGSVGRLAAQQKLTQDRAAGLRAGRAGDPAAFHRHSRPAFAALFSRTVGQSGRRRGQGAAAARHRRGAPEQIRAEAGQRRSLRLVQRRFRQAGRFLRAAGRARPHGDGCQRRPRRTAGQNAAARRRRYLAGRLHLAQVPGWQHGQRHERAWCRRHDGALGIHLRRRPGKGDRRGGTEISVPRRKCARHRMERGRLRQHEIFRARRREDCRDRPGLPVHADRQPALPDGKLVVRHPREGCAQGGRDRAPQGRLRRAAEPQRFRCRPQAGVARRRHRRHPDRPYPRCAAGGREGREYPAHRFRLPR